MAAPVDGVRRGVLGSLSDLEDEVLTGGGLRGRESQEHTAAHRRELLDRDPGDRRQERCVVGEGAPMPPGEACESVGRSQLHRRQRLEHARRGECFKVGRKWERCGGHSNPVRAGQDTHGEEERETNRPGGSRIRADGPFASGAALALKEGRGRCTSLVTLPGLLQPQPARLNGDLRTGCRRGLRRCAGQRRRAGPSAATRR